MTMPAVSGGGECPSPDLLAQMAVGTHADLPASVEAHLLECERCLSILDALDPPTDALMEALAAMPDTADDEPALQEARRTLYAAAVTIRVEVDATAAAAIRLPLADPPLGPLPVQLGNYELIECIGRGATGAVYRGRHVKLDQPVAVKVLDATRLSREHGIDRFFQEMKTVGQLRHPNIIRATDAGEADGWHFLVMEFADGLDASRLLRLAGPLSLSDACEIGRQAALGLEHAHARSLVHRDVKPSNLFVTTAGEVKLLDLGIAATIGDASQEGANRVGTVGYAPPEQWQRKAPIDARADLYSLGCTLRKLLTGSTPTPSAGDRAAASKRLTELPGSWPRGFVRLLEQMLAPVPADRPASAASVSEQLAAWTTRSDLAGLVARLQGAAATSSGVVSPPNTPAQRSTTRLTRRRALGMATAAAAGLLTWRFTTEPSPRLDRLRPRKLSLAPPEVFLAAGPQGNVIWEVADDDSIRVESTALALLHLGRPVIGKYKLSVDLLQDQWLGDIGVFFRGRHVVEDDQRYVEFQTLELQASHPLDPTPARRLLWSSCRAPYEDRQTINRQLWAEVTVAMQPDPGPQRLEAVFGRTGMPEVSWNGVALDAGAWTVSTEGRTRQRLAATQLSTAFLGKLGLVNGNGRSTFLRPRLTYL